MRIHRILAAVAFVSVTGACDLTDLEVDPNSVPDSEIIRLGHSRASSPTMPADGMSLDTLWARIPAEASQRQVTFSTSAGTFDPTLGKVLKVRASVDASDSAWLVAQAVLRSDTTTGRVVFSATVAGDFTAWDSIRFLAVANAGGGE